MIQAPGVHIFLQHFLKTEMLHGIALGGLVEKNERKETFFKICHSNKKGLHDIQHNDIQHNGTQHNNIQHNGTQHNNIQHNDIQHNELIFDNQRKKHSA
jgi:hypothetical protein